MTNLAVKVLDRVGRRNLAKMLEWEAQEGERIGKSALEDRRRFRQRLGGHFADFCSRSLSALDRDLVKDGAQSCSNLRFTTLRNVRQRVAKEVHLQGRAVRRRECGSQPLRTSCRSALRS